MTPEEFLNGLKKAKEEEREIILIYNNHGRHVVSKISVFGDLEKASVEKNTISFEKALLPQNQYYDIDLIKEVYVGNKMI
jgi:hypothetical protein